MTALTKRLLAEARTVMNQTIKNETTQETAGLHNALRERAKEQGVKPVSRLEDLQSDFWAENESVDDFLNWVQTVRRSNQDSEIAG